MFFKSMDKMFEQLKQVISIIVFALIALSLLMLLYWVMYAAKLTLPEWLNGFIWGIIGFFEPLFKNVPTYTGSAEVMPVFTALVLGIMIYALNCVNSLLEDIQAKTKNARELSQIQLEKTINTQLKKSFYNELQKNSFMLVKIKINIEKEDSYLAAEELKSINTVELSKEIAYKILSEFNSDLIKNKGKTNNSVYFMITDLDKTKNFFMELVAKSTKIINEHKQRFLNIHFGCAVEMYEHISEFERVNDYLEKVLDLRQTNKIIVSPTVKVYFESIHPELYYFKLLGEYNIKNMAGVTKSSTLYTIQRR